MTYKRKNDTDNNFKFTALDMAAKNHRTMEKETEANQSYNESLINYKRKYGISFTTIFEYPFAYFYLFQNRLYSNSLKLEIRDDNKYNLLDSMKLPYDKNDACIDNLFNSLKVILKTKKTLKYYDYVNQYKIRFKITFCFLDSPEKFFKIIDNNLCYLDGKKVTAIVDKYIQEIFNSYKLPLPSYYERKNIFCSLTKLAMEVPQDIKPCENPYYINYSVWVKSGVNVIIGNETKTQYIEKDHISIEYNKNNKTFIHKKVLYNPYLNYKHTPIIKDLAKHSEIYYPIHFFELLYALTDGNLETVDKLSEVFAYILAGGNICNKLTVFYVSEKEEALKSILEILVNNKDSTMSLKSICASKNIKNLINLKLSGNFLNISINDNLPCIENIKTLNKIINSKPFSAKDGYLGKKTFINNMHLVYITNKDINIIKLSNNYKINLIKLNTSYDNLESLISSFANDPIQLQWVRTVFTLHGLKHIAEKDSKANIKSHKKASISNGFTNFIKSCCEVSPKAECYAEDIYKSYVEFYNKFYKGEAISRRRFTELLKSSGKYKYYRPHHSKKDNRNAFLGISIDHSKFSNVMNKNEQNPEKDSNKQKIEEYLKSMNNLFNNMNL